MLKLLACVFMLIDHIGYFFYDVLPPEVTILLRAVGRLAFPLFAYTVAMGFRRTRNSLRYLCRMLFFGLLAEGILRAAAAWTGDTFPVNVLLTFSTAIVFLIGYELATHSYWDLIATMKLARSAVGSHAVTDFNVRISLGDTGVSPNVGLPLGVVFCLAAVASNLLIAPDYGLYGLATVWVLHKTAARIRSDEPDLSQTRTLRSRTWIGITALNLAYLPIRVLIEQVAFEWALLQLFSMLAIPILLAEWPDRRPGRAARYAFYLFYPLHIAALMLLSKVLQG